MIVDTSAIIAILKEEDDAAVYAQAIAAARARRLSAAGYLECGIVLDSQRDPIISRGLDEFILEAEFVVEPVTERQARLARRAVRRFWQRQRPPGWSEFRGLPFLRARTRLPGAVALERRRLWAHRNPIRAAGMSTAEVSAGLRL